MTIPQPHHRSADLPSSTPPIDRAEPTPGVLVLRVAGAVRTPLAQAVDRCLAESPSVLVLDLSSATACDGEGAALLATARAKARTRGVAVELVVSTYEVARALRFSEPDALLGAWPELSSVLSTICGPQPARVPADVPITRMDGLP